VVITISWNCQRAYWCKDKKVLGRLWKGLFTGGKRKPNRRRIEGKKEGKKKTNMRARRRLGVMKNCVTLEY
jgi:hypothetical protein